jgi:hypothetical protein
VGVSGITVDMFLCVGDLKRINHIFIYNILKPSVKNFQDAHTPYIIHNPQNLFFKSLYKETLTIVTPTVVQLAMSIMQPSREEAQQARVEQLEKENWEMKRENLEMKNDMANMARGVMSVFEELLLRKMRDASANFDDFPKEAIDDWSAHMYDQSSKLDKCEPMLRDATALLEKCETEKEDLNKNAKGLENALMNERDTTSTELNLRKQVELATDTISGLQNQLHLKADARSKTMLMMRTTLYERSKSTLTILKKYFIFILMAYVNHLSHISTLPETTEEREKLMGDMYQRAVDGNELHGHGFTRTPRSSVQKSFSSSSRGGGMLPPEQLRAFNEMKKILNLD